MGLTGKYNFKGIKSASALTVFTAFAASPFLSWTTNGLVGRLTILLLEAGCNWLANKGLVILNVGHDYLKGHIDQAGLESAMKAAIKRVHETKTKLTPEEVKAIDDEVIAAFDKFAVHTKLK